MTYFDELETRSADERASGFGECLQALITGAKALPGYAALDIDPGSSTDVAGLSQLPVLRKSDLGAAQKAAPPFGGFAASADFTHVFQSPGPLYEPGRFVQDWWRFGRFLHATGIGADDIVQNCFSYRLTHAGVMFENGARAVGAATLPAGTGQTELQAQAAAHLGCTA